MFRLFSKKSLFLTIFKLAPSAILSTITDAALLFGIKSFVQILNQEISFTVFEWFICMILLSVLRFFFLKTRSAGAQSIFLKWGVSLQAEFLKIIRKIHPKFFHEKYAEIKIRSALEAIEILPRSGESFMQALQGFIQLFVFLPILFYLSTPLTLILFCCILPLFVLTEKKIRKMGNEEQKTLESKGELRTDFEFYESLIKNCSAKEELKYTAKNLFYKIRAFYKDKLFLSVKKISLSLLIETVSVIAMIFVLTICAYMITHQMMEVKDLVLYSSAVFLCYKPLKECTKSLPDLRSALTAYNTLSDLKKFPKKPHQKTGDSLEITSGCFNYKEISVFKNFNFQFSDSKPIFLYGINGAGKSTLLKLLASLEFLDAGEIKFPDEVQEKGVFFVSQNLFLPPLDFLREKIKAALPEIQNFKNLIKAEVLLQKQKHSGGEQAKLALLFALVSKSSLLLLDEPLAYISRFEKDEILKVFLDTSEKLNKKIILSGHEALPESLAKRFTFTEIKAL